MRLGTLIRASTLLAVFWIVTLGPRSYPAFVAARDADSLPRAWLLVDSDGCERDEVHDQVWRCRSVGSLAGDGPPENRQAVLRYEAYGEEGPDRRYEVGTRIAVALAPTLTGAVPRLFDARRVADQAREELRWLARQPVASVGTALLGWLALGVTARLRRTRRRGTLEFAAWPGVPALALALAGLAVSFGAAWFEPLPLSVGISALLLLLVPIAPALWRKVVEVDRGAGMLREGHEVGPWRQLGQQTPFWDIAEVRLHDALHVQGLPAWQQWRVELGGLVRSWDLTTAHPRRATRIATEVSAYLGVPMLLPHEPSRIPLDGARLRDDAHAAPDADDGGALEADGGEGDEEWLASLAQPQAPTPEPPPLDSNRRRPLTPRERLRNLPRGLLVLAAILSLALGAVILDAGGIDPFAARLLEPEVESWPAGRLIRRAAVTVVSMRARDARTFPLLVRLAHTLPPQHPLWVPVMEAAQRLLGAPFALGDPPAALARLDEGAARVLDKPIGPLGVLGWWDLHEYWVMWLDDLVGADEALAIERFNGLRPPDGLPTGEWFLVNVGRALVDRRPIPFAVVAEDVNGGQRPLAVERSSAAGRRALDIATVGEALAILLAMYPEHRPESLPDDVARWWAPVANARGLPPVGRRVD